MTTKIFQGIALVVIGAVILTASVSCASGGKSRNRAQLAQAFRAQGEAVVPAPDGTIFCEAEEFSVGKSGWRAGVWGENYYAATLANTFLSRKAFLGAPAECEETVASIKVDVKEAGRYLTLVRYEAPYRFASEFRVKVEQGGQIKLDRLYGAKDNIKIWPFGYKLKPEVVWSWGPVENMVWEGHDAYVDLKPGLAKITLIAGPQPKPGAKRNVDIVMLTTDEEQVKRRIEKEQYLPLDGWLTQAGDVWLRVSNAGGTPVKVETLNHAGWPTKQHSPYWIHLRNEASISMEVPPGGTTEWIEVGSTMDTLNDGQWGFQASGPCKMEFGVRNADGQIEKVREFQADGRLDLTAFADVRYSRTIQTPDEGVAELMDYIKKVPVHGRPPSRMVVYAQSSMMEQLRPLYGFNGEYVKGPKALRWRWPPKPTPQEDAAELEAKAKALPVEGKQNLFVLSMGDEIGLPAPDQAAAKEGFVQYLKGQGVGPAQVNPAAGDDWDKVAYALGARDASPGAYYWSRRYLYHYGISEQKKLTDALRRHLPNANVGANFSPHHGGYAHSYLGEVFKWVSCFRQDGMTLPWSEDYIWQVPVGTQQMNGIGLDLFRAGLRHKPSGKIMYYVMPHMPGNTPASWRRLYHNAVAHGMTIMNMFEFNPVWAAYTENHTTGKEMYGMVLRTLRELGLYDDIVIDGRRRDAEVGLWFSETGDIWHDNSRSFAAGKRGLYVAVLGTGHALDVVVTEDALDGTLGAYKVLYLTDNHVSEAASAKIAEWVRQGGKLFATAGAGMFDEYNRPNRTLRKLMGVELVELVAPKEAHVGFIKTDLPFADALTQVHCKSSKGVMDVYGLYSKVKVDAGATVEGTFKDVLPAVVSRKVGNGATTYCGFLPSLSYFKPAIPLRPVDRGSTDDAMSHFIPTAFDKDAAKFIGSVLSALTRPVETRAELIETAVIESEAGNVIVLQNWSGKPVQSMTVTVNIPVPTEDVSLASGGAVAVKKQGSKTTFTFDMEMSGDVLVLRP